MSYDSTIDTMAHISAVRRRIELVVVSLRQRSLVHDASKLEEPEKALFDEWTPKLKALTYGSDEYKAGIAAMGPGVAHHYAHNSHHPEHYPDGIAGMSPLDLIEMLCDWAAAVERHADGDLAKSLEINRVRFEIDDHLYLFLVNMAKELGWIST